MLVLFFFFKQKTAYEMRISDWSSDVCSSDLPSHPSPRATAWPRFPPLAAGGHAGLPAAIRVRCRSLVSLPLLGGGLGRGASTFYRPADHCRHAFQILHHLGIGKPKHMIASRFKPSQIGRAPV